MYPSITQYATAISIPESFATKSTLRPVLKEDGMPYFSAGGYAVVFQMQCEETGRRYALKCFTREQEHRAESFLKISEYLSGLDTPYLLPYEYLENELWVEDADYPVLLMEWVDGDTLDRRLADLCRENDPAVVASLAGTFDALGVWLLEQELAHGDLKPDNIIIRPSGQPVLIDYDGMFVPAMAGEKSRELGTQDWRHPQRKYSDFNRYLDDFPILVISLSLHVFAAAPDLYHRSGNADNLLFTEADFLNPYTSNAFVQARAWQSHEDIAPRLALLQYAVSLPLLQLIGLDVHLKRTAREVELKIALSLPNVIPYRKGNKWGFCSSDKVLKIECIYDCVTPINDKFVAVRKDKKWRLFDWETNENYIAYEGKDIVKSSLVRGNGQNAYYNSLVSNYYLELYDFEVYPQIDWARSTFYECTEITVLKTKLKEKQREYLNSIVKSDSGKLFFRKTSNGKQGLSDSLGKMLTPFDYYYIGDFHDGIACVAKNMRLVERYSNRGNRKEKELFNWGYIDENGKIVVQCKYTAIRPLKNEYFFAATGLKYERIYGEYDYDEDGYDSYDEKIIDNWGVIDKNGYVFIDFIYSELNLFRRSIFRAKLNGKYGLIDSGGKILMPFDFCSIEDFDGSGCIVLKDWFYGVMDLNGAQIIPFKFREIERFSIEYIEMVYEVDEFFGEICLEGGYKKYKKRVFLDSYFKVKDENNKIGVITNSGKVVLPCKYDLIEACYDSYVDERGEVLKKYNVNFLKIAIGEYQDVDSGGRFVGVFGLINTDFTVIVNCQYDYISDFYNDVAIVMRYNENEQIKVYYTDGSIGGYRQATRYGLLDKYGNEIVSCKYDSMKHFIDDKFVISIDYKYGIINNAGEIIVPCLYEQICPISENMAAVATESWIEEVCEDVYDDNSESLDWIWTEKRFLGKWGYVNQDGLLLIPAQFDSVNPFKNDYARVNLNGKDLYVDKAGTVITGEQLKKIADMDLFNAIPEEAPFDLDDSPSFSIFREVENTLRKKTTEKNNISENFDLAIGLAYKNYNGERGIFDPKNRLILKCNFDSICKIKDMRFCVRQNDKYGVINQFGDFIIPCIYEVMIRFANDLILVGNATGKIGFIDLNGNKYWEEF